MTVRGGAYANATQPRRFALPVVLVGSVFLLDQFAPALIDVGSQFILLGIAVLATAWLGGTGPALLATVLAALLGARQGAEHPGAGSMHLALFLVQGLVLTGVLAEVRRARRDAERRAHEAQAAQEEGESARRLKDAFLATVSHELRTPLNAVLGWVHLLRTGKLDAATAARGLESIDRNVRLQAQLTSDLLDVSKALTGTLTLDSRPVPLDEAARQAVAAATPAAVARGVRIESSLPPAGLPVHGDPMRLRQIAWQLLANAIKFSPRGGAVEITVDTFGQDARVIVRDSGPGIAPEFLPRVFERFTREEASVERHAGGLGVGLALVRELVELQGGEIEARNRADGRGAIFVVRFPLQAGALAASAGRHHPSVEAGLPVLDGLRVLVLDQEPEAGELLGAVLQGRGAAVRTVETVADALHVLEEWRPDVLVSDSRTPEHDSYAVVGKVRSLDAERGGRIPAVALTSVARTDERLRELLAGVQRDVPKPVEPSILTTEIARLAGRERRRAHR